jgi:hypothetical protein
MIKVLILGVACTAVMAELSVNHKNGIISTDNGNVSNYLTNHNMQNIYITSDFMGFKKE